jgi:hypothetical protein
VVAYWLRVFAEVLASSSTVALPAVCGSNDIVVSARILLFRRESVTRGGISVDVHFDGIAKTFGIAARQNSSHVTALVTASLEDRRVPALDAFLGQLQKTK